MLSLCLQNETLLKRKWVNANKTRWDYNKTTVLPKFQSLKLSRDQCTTFMQAKTSNIEMGYNHLRNQAKRNLVQSSV